MVESITLILKAFSEENGYRFQVSGFRMRDKNGGFIGKKCEIIVFLTHVF
jgi:hypothetical protein